MKFIMFTIPHGTSPTRNKYLIFFKKYITDYPCSKLTESLLQTELRLLDSQKKFVWYHENRVFGSYNGQKMLLAVTKKTKKVY